MVSDSISDSYSSSGSPNSWNFGKKTIVSNWSAKLKQWRLEEDYGQSEKGHVNGCGAKTWKMDSPFGNMRMGWRNEEINDAIMRWNIERNAESLISSSPTSVLMGKDSGKEISHIFCCSGDMEEEEEDIYIDAFDNFEGFSDALNHFEEEDDSPSLNSDQESRGMAIHGEKSDLMEGKKNKRKSHRCKKNSSRETKSLDDDASSTQRISNILMPFPCPICCEEMDETDLNFLPCPCGFKLCLFCHKKIIDNDRRCPSCRKMYGTSNVSGEVSFHQRGREALRLSPSFRGLDRA